MINGTIVGGGWLFGVLIAVGVVLLIILLVRMVGGGVKRYGPGDPADDVAARPDSPRHVLDSRYANGELTTEDYRERLRILGGDT